jgi:phosphopentomutase
MFYGWEPLRDICLPGSLQFATYINAYAYESSDTVLTDACEKLLTEQAIDFAFLYMVETDEKGGHDNGWMSEEYLRRISVAIDNVKRIVEKFGDEYSIIVMADHGGHERSHGTTAPEDMTVPLFFYGKDFPKGKVIEENISLLEIAPTIAALLGLPAEHEWEGRSLV